MNGFLTKQKEFTDFLSSAQNSMSIVWFSTFVLWFTWLVPLKTPFGPRIGLNEQIPLRDIKQVTVEKKSFSMYGDMTRISLSVLRDKELTTTYLYPRFLPDNNAEKVANELNHFLGIEVV